MSRAYDASIAWLERARRTIPLGSQTFSKSITQYPLGVSPLFIRRGRGSRVWDLDDNEYIDWVNALLSVTLGHADADVNAAVQQQLADGTSHSLPHTLETEVAERIVSLVPCAEMVRFGKNGSDATSAAVRLARAHTGRERVAVCGYHGWQDWYIGTTSRDLGVPGAVKALSHAFVYNRADSLERLLRDYAGQFAAVIMEPMNTTQPEPGFLERVRELCDAHGALLVFDETITGFRFALGGAQALFGVTPDLATFGKGLANGLPLSVVAGPTRLMQLMEKIFFSVTFGGETLSLAAARAVLDKLEREPVLDTIAERGQQILAGLAARIARHDAGRWLMVSGHPSWSFVTIRDTGAYSAWQLKTLWLQEMFERGMLSLGTHNLSYAHSTADVAALLRVYDEILPMITAVIRDERLGEVLRCEPLKPLFRPRG